MHVAHIVEQLSLSAIEEADLAREISGGYASDLLSCVMAGAAAGNVWVTLQCHPNVVAVASLLDLSAVIITEGMVPDEETVHKAHEARVNLLGTAQDTFTVVGRLAALGVEGNKPG
ncbi:MAG: DRTGG domain-containing protein [Anaerolineae bacterium]|jgi:hypothetical protein